MATNKYARFFALLGQANRNGCTLTKEEVIMDVTDKRTNSLSSLSHWELQEAERRLSAVTVQSQLGIPVPGSQEEKKDRMRKAIISQFLGIGKTVADAKAWAEKYGVFGQKKQFNDYTEQELYQLIKNAEKMKRDAIKAINRKIR
jgi:hypothetical protein